MALKTLTVERKNGEVYSHIRKKGLVETPEERVRQEYLCTLVNEYGYSLEQIDEEVSVVGRGSGNARADFLIWRTPQERLDKKPAFIVVECKADNITINRKPITRARITHSIRGRSSLLRITTEKRSTGKSISTR